jgi:hypothetical protein
MLILLILGIVKLLYPGVGVRGASLRTIIQLFPKSKTEGRRLRIILGVRGDDVLGKWSSVLVYISKFQILEV